MTSFYTVERIKQVLHAAGKLGVTTIISRGDQHIIRMLAEYRGEGGNLTWIAQTCPEMKNPERSIEDIVKGGARGCFIHGGYMDNLLANGRLGEIPSAIKTIRKAGLAAGVAGHDPRVFAWAEKNLDVDFYMCSYYNSMHRDENAEHRTGRPEWFLAEDRETMAATINGLSKPAIHYKVMAAGRNDPKEAFAYVARHMRGGDGVCVGIFAKDKPDMLAEDVRLFDESLGNQQR